MSNFQTTNVGENVLRYFNYLSHLDIEFSTVHAPEAFLYNICCGVALKKYIVNTGTPFQQYIIYNFTNIHVTVSDGNSDCR